MRGSGRWARTSSALTPKDECIAIRPSRILQAGETGASSFCPSEPANSFWCIPAMQSMHAGGNPLKTRPKPESLRAPSLNPACKRPRRGPAPQRRCWPRRSRSTQRSDPPEQLFEGSRRLGAAVFPGGRASRQSGAPRLVPFERQAARRLPQTRAPRRSQTRHGLALLAQQSSLPQAATSRPASGPELGRIAVRPPGFPTKEAERERTIKQSLPTIHPIETQRDPRQALSGHRFFSFLSPRICAMVIPVVTDVRTIPRLCLLSWQADSGQNFFRPRGHDNPLKDLVSVERMQGNPSFGVK